VIVLLLLVLASCGVEQEVKGLGGDIADLSYCQFADCGQVFLCDLGSSYYRASGPGHTTTPELCVYPGDASYLEGELSYKFLDAKCEPTPRGGVLGWPCLYQCPSAHGCNQGCFCE